MNEAVEVVLMNCPASPLWSEESFLGCLESSGVWDMTKYWQLEYGLHSLIKYEIDTSMYAAVFKIFARISRLFSANYHELDVFEFKNLTPDDLLEFHERVEMMFEGVFLKKMPDQDWFTLKNPYL